jgi:hypothetical protein
LNTDLFSDKQKYFYTNQMVKLKDKMSWIKNGEGFNRGKAECAGVLNLGNVAEEFLRGRNCR